MISRPAANRAELASLALAWASFGLLTPFAPFWVILLAAALATTATGVIVFGVIEPRTRSEYAARAAATALARAAGTPGDVSLRHGVDLAAAELALLRSRVQEFERVVDSVSDPIIATDPSGVIRVANAGAALFAGASGSVVGRTIDELFSQNALLALHAAASAGRSVHDLVTIHRGEGKRTFNVYATPTGDPGQPGAKQAVVLTLQDVTELAAAVRAQTDFVANASHELRTPLASIRAAAETIETAHDDPPMVDRLTEMIRANCTRLEDLLTDLLDLSRLQSEDVAVERVAVDVDGLFADLREHFASALSERRLTLAFERPPELSSLVTEAKSLRLILRNLIENSTKFAYEGTEIVVRLRRPTPGLVRLDVSDRGIGIPIGAQARIFDRFYQVDGSRSGTARRRGTGLGLSMVKQAAVRLGGGVGVESVWKEGTTMFVELPFVEG